MACAPGVVPSRCAGHSKRVRAYRQLHFEFAHDVLEAKRWKRNNAVHEIAGPTSPVKPPFFSDPTSWRPKSSSTPENVVMLFTRSMGVDRCHANCAFDGNRSLSYGLRSGWEVDRCHEAARSMGADRCHEDCATDGSRSLSRGLHARLEQIVVMRAVRSMGADRCHEDCELDGSRSLSRGLRARLEQIVVMRAARSIGADRCRDSCALGGTRSLS